MKFHWYKIKSIWDNGETEYYYEIFNYSLLGLPEEDVNDLLRAPKFQSWKRFEYEEVRPEDVPKDRVEAFIEQTEAVLEYQNLKLEELNKALDKICER
jgi:ferritin-like protein